jgi:hypothetical protein
MFPSYKDILLLKHQGLKINSKDSSFLDPFCKYLQSFQCVLNIELGQRGRERTFKKTYY